MYPESVTFIPNPERLRRLKYLTKNYNSLQDLMMAAGGIEMLVFRISPLVKYSWLSFLMWVFGIVVGFIALRRLPDYYERRFGHVEQQSGPITPVDALGCLGFIVGLFVFVVFSGPLGRFFNYIWTAINGRLNATFAPPDHHLNFLPIFCWLVVLVMNFAFRPLHQVDWRKIPLWLGGTIVWSAVMLLPLHHPNLVNLTWWRVLDDDWLWISFIIIGLYNHLTLVWLFSKTSEAEP